MISLLQNLINKGSSALKSKLTTISKNAAKPDTKKTVLFKSTLPPELAKSTSIMDNSGSAKVVPNPFISPNFVSGATLSAEAPEKTWTGTSIQDRLAQAGSAAKTGNVARAITLFGSSLNPELKKLTEIGAQQKAQQEIEAEVASKYPTTQTPNWPTPSLNPLDVVKKQAPIVDIKKSAFYQLPKSQQTAEVKKAADESTRQFKIQNIIQQADQAFTSSLKKVRPDLVPQTAGEEATQMIKSAPGEILGKAIHGAISGLTMGLSDMAKERYGLDYENNLPTIYQENEGLKSVVSAVGGVASFVGNMAGGGATFGAIAKPMSAALQKIPVVGKVLAAHPVFTSYVVDNAALNAATGVARKSMGLDYTPEDFFSGMIQNAAFMFGGSLAGKVLGKFESSLIRAEKQKGSKLTTDEVNNVLFNTKVTSNMYGRDLFNEKRLAFLKGKKEGTPGIDIPTAPQRTSLESPSVKDFAKYKEMAPEVNFPNPDSMKLIRDKATGDIVGVQNRTGQKKMFSEEGQPPVQGTEDSVKIFMDALKAAEPIRAKQEAIYHQERSQRAAKIVEIGKTSSGEAGFYAQKAALKGEMGKPEFEGIRSKLTQPVIDDLFSKIEASDKILPFEKITAKNGLAKLLGADGGRTPTEGELKLLKEIFPPEFVKTVMDKRPLVQKLWGTAMDVLNLPRALMSSFDLSAPFRQGALLTTKPKQFFSAFTNMFRYALSEKAHTELLQEIKSRPTYELMKKNNLALTDSTSFAPREEAFLSKFAENLPGVKQSARAYSGFLNKLRADVFDDLYKKAEITGATKDNPKLAKDLAEFVNTATGRGELGSFERAASVLNGVFFSPRLMASRLQTFNPARYVRMDPFVRKEALKSLFAFAASTSTVLGLAKMAGADVGLDPRSADFGKIKIGNSRFDILGGFQQYIVLASRLGLSAAKGVGLYKGAEMVSSTTGKEFTLGEGYKPTTALDVAARFLESKESPITSFAIGLMKGKTSIGEDFNVPAEVTKRFIPMVAQDVFDLTQEYGPEGAVLAIPGLFGVGSQTYSDPIPQESRTAKGKPTVKYASKPGLAESLVNLVTGTEVKPTPVKATYDKVQELVKSGNIDEAKKMVDDLSDNDYALYKKFKQKDNQIKKDELTSKVLPVYNEIVKLKEAGNIEEAKQKLDSLSDEEYKIYSDMRDSDLKNLQ